MSKHTIDPNGSNIVHHMRLFVAECKKRDITPSRELLVAAPEMYEFVKHITEKWENMPLAPDKLYGKKMMVKSSSFAALLMQDTAHKARALLAKIEGE